VRDGRGDGLVRRTEDSRTTFDVLVDAAGLDPALALARATWRTTDYWLWGLEHGLTEDPVRCARVIRALLDG
jgi:hypothetical protein